MRIQPIINRLNNIKNNNNKKQTQFERSNSPKKTFQNHQYTGNASADLAYASMFDSKIAYDLKLMGLI